jgi:hypothetical protein
MFKVFRLVLLLFLLLPALFVAVTVGLAFYTLENEPLVAEKPPVDYATIVAGKELLKRVNRQIESSHNGQITVVITETELENLARMGAHTFDWFSAESKFDSTSVHSSLSLRLTPNPAGDYFNMSVQLDESSEGVHIDRVTIGPADFSGRWLLPLMARIGDVVLQDQQATLLLGSVRGFQLDGSTALLSVYPPPNAKAHLKRAVRKLQASRFPAVEQARVVHYYDLLAGMGNQWRHSHLSFNAYLTPLMAEAQSRGELGSAVDENRAAMWAMAIYFSNGAFEALLGKLVSSDHRLSRSPEYVTLGGRQDLMLHFIYSAGITLATQEGIGYAAGEFKELLDSGDGGSGFSFADLAADRAGIRFVEAATASEPDARQLQQSIVNYNSEKAFFPGIEGMSEGLSEAQFRRLYGSTEAEEYGHQVRLIDERIARLWIYSAPGG